MHNTVVKCVHCKTMPCGRVIYVIPYVGIHLFRSGGDENVYETDRKSESQRLNAGLLRTVLYKEPKDTLQKLLW